MLIFVLNMPKEHVSQRTQAFKSHWSQMMATPYLMIETDARNDPSEILVFPHQDCDCALAFLQGEHWIFSILSFPFLVFGTSGHFHVPLPLDGVSRGQEGHLMGREWRVG